MIRAPVTPFELRRFGPIMEPEAGNPLEIEGVLNPAAARGPDGHLYLFPRLVGRGNFSRIGIARVEFNASGDPTGVERLGIALEPEAEYELRPGGTGGCEDPRVSFVDTLGHYVMTYTAFSPRGPRIALAASEDLLHWRRLGLVTFEPYGGIEFDGIDNKDSAVFPTAVPDPDGKPALALLHRPLFPGTRPEEKAEEQASPTFDLQRESIWISYRDIDIPGGEPERLSHFTSHHRLASPVAAWERLKIGTGAPPVLTRHGWLLLYHGVSQPLSAAGQGTKLAYSAGVMVLQKEDPRHILYRSPHPVLKPELPEERQGSVADVVFPTGVDLISEDRLDVYYGMADDRIGAAQLDVPENLPDFIAHLRSERT